MNRFYGIISILITLTSSITQSQTPLPIESTTLFSGSGNCQTCHEPNDFNNALKWNDVDVSPITYWRSTMMANASKDPFWRAEVSEEVHLFPALKEIIESTCTKCHAPMGYTQAIYDGEGSYSMDSLRIDPLANDGVSCTVCHQIQPDNFGSADSSYSGGYLITDERTLYGPYDNPDTTWMQGFVEYTAKFGPHLNQAELCATCHTLFTPYLDNGGNIAGYFPEQTAYLEWKNSDYYSQNFHCQDCHMPKIYDPMIITTIPPDYGVERTPYWLHNFVGGNVYMLNMLQDNINELGISASVEHFDSTIFRTEINLSDRASNLSAESWFENDSIVVQVTIENNAGHKLPTGIPFRRMWLHLKVEESSDNVVFESGKWDSTGNIINYDSHYEPHYQKITSEEQVQVYEAVPLDVDDQVTYTLLRAASYVKDNRIPPKGFTSSHLSYDTTKIYGNALNDPDFNKDGTTEGTGKDIITYKFPKPAGTDFTASVKLCYQSIKPRTTEHLRSISEPDIDSFLVMYDELPNLPFILQSTTVDIVTGDNDKNLASPDNFILYQNYPNPFNPVTTISFTIPAFLKSPPYQGGEAKQGWFVQLKVYDILGNEVTTLVNEEKPAGTYAVDHDASKLTSGIYYYQITAGDYKVTKKMILLK